MYKQSKCRAFSAPSEKDCEEHYVRKHLFFLVLCMVLFNVYSIHVIKWAQLVPGPEIEELMLKVNEATERANFDLY